MDVNEAIDRGRRRRHLPDPTLRRHLRESAGLTQEDVASALGVRASAVSRWERGLRTPRGEKIYEYSRFLETLLKEVGT